MAQPRLFQRAFAGGEIGPELFGRIDDAKFQNGAARMRNFIAKPQGTATRRPGFKFVREVKDSTKTTRLLRFAFSSTQSLVVEIGEGYLRWHTQGATLTHTPRAYVYSRTVTFNTGTGEVTWSGAIPHTLQENDPVQITSNGTMPTGIPQGDATLATTYYAAIISPTVIKLRTTPGGATINSYALAGSGTITAHYLYQVGDSMTWSGGTPANGPYYCIANVIGTGPASGLYWYAQPTSGIYEIPNFYTTEALPDIHYHQSGNVMTLLHPSFQPAKLTRLGAAQWTFGAIQFNTTIATPTLSAVTPTFGDTIRVVSVATGVDPIWSTSPVEHHLSVNESVYMQKLSGSITVNDGYYIVHRLDGLSGFRLRSPAGPELNNLGGTGTANVRIAAQNSDTANSYRVTALDSELRETVGSNVVSATNNLNVAGASNLLTWTAVAGASRYRVYKLQSGLYGLIGETDGTTFVDDNIGPDLALTLPLLDSPFGTTGNEPQAGCFFEQRQWFAGTPNKPQDIWATRTGTDSDMAYHLPALADDRIYFRVASLDASSIRHLIPMAQLLVLTSSAEYRVTPINNDAITPESISVRPQSYIGCSNVQPSVINNSVVFCAARGGHVREMGFSVNADGFVTGDLSLRAAHLFDGLSIVDQTYGKAPTPVVWFTSSNGRLLGLTYVPEESVGAWHWHDTDGRFEYIASVPEGSDDVLYAVVQRTINGATKRYIECSAPTQWADLDASAFCDSSIAFDGTNTTSTTVTVAGDGIAGSYVTITASAGIFTVGTSDIGDEVRITYSGTTYRMRVTSVTSTTVATALLLQDIPSGLLNFITTAWAWARDQFTGLGHLEGKTVAIVADGVVQSRATVTGGTLANPLSGGVAVKVRVGLPYLSDLQTVPLIMQMDSFGQGREKNINKVWVRTFQSSPFLVGPGEDALVPVGSIGVTSGDQAEVVPASWDQYGQILIRQSDPLPLTVIGMTIEVAIGG